MRLESSRRSQSSSIHTRLSIGGAIRVSTYAPLELAFFSRAKVSNCGLSSKRTDMSSEWRTPHRCSIAGLPMSLRDHRAISADEANTRLCLPQESGYAGSRKQVRSWNKPWRPEGSQMDGTRRLSSSYFLAVDVIVHSKEIRAGKAPRTVHLRTLRSQRLVPGSHLLSRAGIPAFLR